MSLRFYLIRFMRYYESFEGEISFHFFEAHSSSKKFYLKELCLKRNCLSRYLYNNINILELYNCFLTGELLGKYN